MNFPFFWFKGHSFFRNIYLWNIFDNDKSNTFNIGARRRIPQKVTHLKSKTSRSKEVHPFVAGNLQSNTFRGFQEKETASSRAVHVLLVHFWGEHVNRDKFCLTVFVFYLTKKHTLCLIFSAFVLLSLPLSVSLSFYVTLYLFCICICTCVFQLQCAVCVFFFKLIALKIALCLFCLVFVFLCHNIHVLHLCTFGSGS